MASVRDFGLVILDCDGVVVDSEVLACGALAATLARHGLPITLDEVFARFLGRSFAAVEEYFRAETGEPMPEHFRIDHRARLDADFRASLKPMPRVGELLGTLDRPYCLASSSDAERIRLTLAIAGLEACFGDRIYSAAMVEHGKPAPDLFLLVAERMGGRPGEALVIEDTVPGVLAGKAAGMTVWGFVGGGHCRQPETGRQLAAAGADRIVASMGELLP